jgi:hypothetical protein
VDLAGRQSVRNRHRRRRRRDGRAALSRFGCRERVDNETKDLTDMHLRHPHPHAPRQRPRRFGTNRSRGPAAWLGQGTAWLVHDVGRDCYHCYWLVGRPNDHLIESATEPSAPDAVEWARCRTPRARIRLGDHRTYWAGTDPAPRGFEGTWTPASRA